MSTRRTTGAPYAIFVYHGLQVLEDPIAEVNVLLSLEPGHQNVNRLVALYEDDHSLYIVLEYCDGGDLQQVISKSPGGRLAEADARAIMWQLLQGESGSSRSPRVLYTDRCVANFTYSLVSGFAVDRVLPNRLRSPAWMHHTDCPPSKPIRRHRRHAISARERHRALRLVTREFNACDPGIAKEWRRPFFR